MKGKQSNRIEFQLEFYLRGETRRIPSVNFTFGGDGLHMDVIDSPEYDAFSRAAHELCRKLKEMGELRIVKTAKKR